LVDFLHIVSCCHEAVYAYNAAERADRMYGRRRYIPDIDASLSEAVRDCYDSDEGEEYNLELRPYDCVNW